MCGRLSEARGQRAMMRPIPVPHAPVTKLVGRAFTLVTGQRCVEYADEQGRRYTCISDGVSRQWYETTSDAPHAEQDSSTPTKEL